MYLLQTIEIECPYCAEQIEIVVDASIGQQQYVEDCSVCCKPIHLTVLITDEDDIRVQAVDEDAC